MLYMPEAVPSPEPLPLKDQIRQALFDLDTHLQAVQTPGDVELYAMSAMERLPEASDNAREIQQIRERGQDDSEAVEKQKNLFETIKSEIALISGVELEESRVTRENAQYRTKAQEIFGAAATDDPRTLLVKTGFLKEEPDQQPTFQFPSTLFPPHISEKWERYLGIVKRHVTAISRRQMGLEDDVIGITQLDKLRSGAHNTISLAIKDFLDLQDWDLEKSRRLVIKMRDSAIPNIETAEEDVTASAIGRFLTELAVLKD